MGISKSLAKPEIDIEKLSEERQIHYHLPDIGFWTLRSSEAIIDEPFSISMFRRCFDNEGNHKIRVLLMSKF